MFRIAALVFLLPVAVLAQDSPAPPVPQIDPSVDAATLFTTVCATCHGAEGEGRKDLLAPSIAGQPDWFLQLQLEKFRKGHRGDPDVSDASGELMRAIALALTPEAIAKLAVHISDLDPVPTTTDLKGDLAEGERLFMETCAACHRYNGHGEKVFRSAPLTSLPDWYIVTSLRKFQEGARGYQHGDLDGPKMREIAESIGEKQIPHLVNYIAHLAEKYPPGVKRRGPRQVPPLSFDLEEEVEAE